MSNLNDLLQEAQSESTDSERLRELATKRNLKVRRACAKNPLTPVEVINTLAASFPAEFLANPTTQLRLLDAGNLLLELPEKSRIALARYQDIPVFLLQKLADDQEWKVREAVAENLNCPVDILGKFLKKDLSQVQSAAARNPNCPSEILKEMNSIDEWSIAAESPNCPPETLANIARSALIVDEMVETYYDKYCQFILRDEYLCNTSKAAGHPNCPPDALIELAENDYEAVRWGVARNSNCLPFVLEKLAQDSDEYIRLAVSLNPNCTPDILESVDLINQLQELNDQNHENIISIIDRLEEILKSRLNSRFYAQRAAAHQSLKHWKQACKDYLILLERANNNWLDIYKNLELCWSQVDRHEFSLLVLSERDHSSSLPKDKEILTRFALAANQSSISDVLENLSTDTEVIRYTVACNPSCPPKVLETLAADVSVDVRQVVAQNPSFLQLSLKLLSQNESYKIRSTVAMCPACPPEILVKLAEDDNHWVQGAVARHLNCPPTIMMALVECGDDEVRELIAENPNCPPEVLVELKEYSYYDWELRKAIAGNPNCPLEILIELARDDVEEVREAVAKNPNCPPRILSQVIAPNTAVAEFERIRISAFLSLLKQACRDKNRVQMYYAKPGEKASKRTLDPYMLILSEKDGRWFDSSDMIRGFCHQRQDIRSFRLDRILHLQLLQERFEPPQD